MATTTTPASAAASSPASSSSSPSSTTPTTTTNAPTTTTTNAQSSSSSAASASASSSSSSATASTQSSSSSTTSSTSSSTNTPIVTSSGSTLETITSFVTGPTATSSPSSQNASTTNSFFSNKATVAGVFSVVGLIVIALAVALIVNAIRRRRAKKFDRDVAEAAAEAAASSRSPFEDYSYPNTGGSGGGGYGYSDNSHGTFQLPPLQPQPHNEAYGMSEMSQYDPYAAGAASLAAASAVGRSRSRKESEPGTPGIAGVGAGTLVREPSKRAPYHAFAGPGPQPHELQGGNGTMRSRRGNQDVLEAAGLAGAAVTAPGNNGGAFVTRKPSETTQNTHLSGRSQFGTVSSGGQHPALLQPGYPVDSYYPQRNENRSPDPFAGYPPVVPAQKPLPNPYESGLSSPPLSGGHSDQNEDVAEMGSPTALRSDEQRLSYQDDADYSQGNRVLRVANE